MNCSRKYQSGFCEIHPDHGDPVAQRTRKSTPRRKAPPLRHAGRRLRILITAGPTREYLDPVRYLSNDSTGRMGFAIAAAAIRRGHRVTLIHGPVALPPPDGARVVSIISAADMLTACHRVWPRNDVLIMSAAVADYRPRRSSNAKIKKSQAELALALEPTTDVLADLAGSRKPSQRVIGFALEDRNPRKNAQSKLERKNLDAIVLNPPAAIGRTRSRVEILRRGGTWTVHAMRDKAAHAEAIVDLAESITEAK